MSSAYKLMLSSNEFSGEIPRIEMVQSHELNEASTCPVNGLTGCVPEGLRYVFFNNFARLGVAFLWGFR